MQNSLQFNIKFSRWLLISILMMHLLALGGICLAFGSIFLQYWLLIIVISSIVFSLYNNRLLKSSKVIYKIKVINNLWQLYYKNSTDSLAVLSGNSFITSYFLVLNFRCITNNSRKTVVLCRDSLTREEFRRLLVFLRVSRC
jgi:hypothetical protein